MFTNRFFSCLLVVAVNIAVHAAPNGAVLILNGKHLSHCRVTTTAIHKYFGELEGPAWENNYGAWRYYADTGNRNSVDIVGKYRYEPVLLHADEAGIELHADHTWGGDIYKCGTTLGLGGFNLCDNSGNWINPGIGVNMDSMTITIADSSMQTPRVVVEYWGLLLNGSKNKVTWTISTRRDIRPTNCEVTIAGSYTGNVVVGMRKYEAANVKLIQDPDKALLATLGNQGGMVETYTDTLLEAIFTEKKYFNRFADNAINYGMVLTPDAGKNVAWSMAYNWAREPEQVYHDPNWQNTLFAGTTAIAKQSSLQGKTGAGSLEFTRSSNGFLFRCPQSTGHLRFIDCRGKTLYSQNVTNGAVMLKNGQLPGTGILYGVLEDAQGTTVTRAITFF